MDYLTMCIAITYTVCKVYKIFPKRNQIFSFIVQKNTHT